MFGFADEWYKYRLGLTTYHLKSQNAKDIRVVFAQNKTYPTLNH